MRCVTITIEAKGESDVADALTEVSRALREGYLSGSNENSTGSYEFDCEGEFNACEVQCDNCGNYGTIEEFRQGRKRKMSCPGQPRSKPGGASGATDWPRNDAEPRGQRG